MPKNMTPNPGKIADLAGFSYNKDNSLPVGSEFEIVKTFEDAGSGYFGVAYKIRGQIDSPIIIAHRGTELEIGIHSSIPKPGELTLPPHINWKDLGTDTQIVKSQVLSKIGITEDLPDQFEQGDQFTKQIMKEFPGAEIIQTGHSMGAGIGQYTAALYHQKSVVFEPPAIGHIIEKYVPGANPDDSQNYIVSGSQVSNQVLTDHFGKVTRLYIRPPDETNLFTRSPMGDHGIDRIRQCFDEDGNVKPFDWDAFFAQRWKDNKVFVPGKTMTHGEEFDEIRTREYFHNNIDEYKAWYQNKYNISSKAGTGPLLTSFTSAIQQKAQGLQNTVKH